MSTSLFLRKQLFVHVWYLNCSRGSMKRRPLDKVPESKKNDSRSYLAFLALVVTGPAVFSAYVFAVWDLTAGMGLTKAFPWSGGPLSNWFTWLALALLLSVGAGNLRRVKQERALEKQGFNREPHVFTN
jgi:hypothetical protein